MHSDDKRRRSLGSLYPEGAPGKPGTMPDGSTPDDIEDSVAMVDHPSQTDLRLPLTLYVEHEGGDTYSAYPDLDEFAVDMDEEETAVLGIYEFKRFVKVEQIRETRITEE